MKAIGGAGRLESDVRTCGCCDTGGPSTLCRSKINASLVRFARVARSRRRPSASRSTSHGFERLDANERFRRSDPDDSAIVRVGWRAESTAHTLSGLRVMLGSAGAPYELARSLDGWGGDLSIPTRDSYVVTLRRVLRHWVAISGGRLSCSLSVTATLRQTDSVLYRTHARRS